MDFITELKQEHAQIERELLELETIAESPEINYPNLWHIRTIEQIKSMSLINLSILKRIKKG
jgi:hypothetical protein